MKELSIQIPEEFTYTKRYYAHFKSLRESSLSAFGRAIFGFVFGACEWKNTCEGTYRELANAVSCSRSTVARSMKRLDSKGMIERVEKKRSEYKITAQEKKDGYALTPDFFYSMTVNFENGEQRKLRPTEIDCLSFVLSWTLNERTGGYIGSVGNVARTLGMRSTTTATEAIEALIRCKLIYRNGTEKSINGQKIYKYVANSELVLAMRKAFAKNKGGLDLTPKAVKNLNELTERKQYYELKQTKADNLALAKERRLRMDRGFVEAYRSYKKLYMEDKPSTERERRYYWGIMTVRAKALNVDPADLEETGAIRRIYSCQKCNDTGDRLDDGMPCDCYKRERKRP